MMSTEVARITAHLAGAERVLRARDTASLSPSVRRVRAMLTRALREYRRAGRFPHNHVSPELTPVFIDEHGTRCAMAHLLELVGAHDLVRRVSRDNNLARIKDLANDPELLRWLAAMGLTVAEAARIQPSYCARRIDCYCQWSETARGVVEGTVSRDSMVGWVLRVEKVLKGTGISVGESLTLTNVVSEPPVRMMASFHADGDSFLGAPLPRHWVQGFECDDLLVGLPVLSSADIIDAVGSTCVSKVLSRDARFGDLICDQPDGGHSVVDAAPLDAAVADSGVVDASADTNAPASMLAEDGSGCGIARGELHGATWLALVAAAFAVRARTRRPS